MLATPSRSRRPNRLRRKVRPSFFVVRAFGREPWGYEKLGFQWTNLQRYRKFTKPFFHRRALRRLRLRSRSARYIYRLDTEPPRPRRRRRKKSFTSLRWVRLFYVIVGYSQFRRMARRARQEDGFFEGHYCLALEGRVATFFYRTGFVATMFESVAMVRQCFVTIHGQSLSFPNAAVGLYRLLRVHPRVKKKVYGDLLVRLCANRRSLFNRPRYMFISHWFLFAFMQQYPMAKDLVLPPFLDIYRATGYAR